MARFRFGVCGLRSWRSMLSGLGFASVFVMFAETGSGAWAQEPRDTDPRPSSSPPSDDGRDREAAFPRTAQGASFSTYRILWRYESVGGVGSKAAVAPDGSIVAATVVGTAFQLDANGKLQWKASLHSAAVVGDPVICTDGTRVLLNSKGRLFGLTPQGRIRFDRQLSFRQPGQRSRRRLRRRFAGLLATRRNSVVIAYRHLLLEVGTDGFVQSRANLSVLVEPQLLASERGVLLLGTDGSWWRWNGMLAPQLLGRCSSLLPSRGLARLDARHVLGLDEVGNPVALALSGGQARTVRLVDKAWHLPNVARDGTMAYVADSAHAVVWVQPDGTTHSVTVPLAGSSAASGTAGAFSIPRPLMDENHRVFVADRVGRVAAVDPSGDIRWSPPACLSGVAWLVSHPAGVLVGCKGGTVALVGASRKR